MKEIKFEEIDHVLTNTILIKSLSEFISAINHVSYQFNDNLWFRGHSKGEYMNLPTIFRKKLGVTILTLVNLKCSKNLKENANC